MEAAQVSKEKDGASVKLRDVLKAARKSARQGPLPWETSILGFAAVLPLFGRAIAEYTSIAVAPAAIAALLAIVTLRCRAEAASSASRGDTPVSSAVFRNRAASGPSRMLARLPVGI